MLEVKDYSEHALTEGSGASAVAYVEAPTPDGATWWGVGHGLLHPRRLAEAVVSAANRARTGDASASPSRRTSPRSAA